MLDRGRISSNNNSPARLGVMRAMPSSGAAHNDFFKLADFTIDIDAVVGVHRLVFSFGAKVGEMMVMQQ